MNSVFVFGYIFLSHFSRDEFSQTNRSKLCHFIFEFVTVGFTILRRRMSFKIIQIYSIPLVPNWTFRAKSRKEH